MFDPLLCGFSTTSMPSCVETQRKRTRDNESMHTPCHDPIQQRVATCDFGVANLQCNSSVPSLPVFVTPVGFASTQKSHAFEASRAVYHMGLAPYTTSRASDHRRDHLLKYRDQAFPMAGLMKDEGGIHGFLDRQRRLQPNTARTPPLSQI